MRTTIRIDDDLYRTVKSRAAAAGRTVAEVIEDAVRVAMLQADAAKRATLAPLPTWDSGGVLPGIDMSSNAAVLDAMEEGLPLDALR